MLPLLSIYLTNFIGKINRGWRRPRYSTPSLGAKLCIALLASVLGLGGCAPQATLEVKPLTINMNVKIDHEIRVKVDKELDALFSDDSDLF